MSGNGDDIRIRVASQADRPSMCQLVVSNHLSLSQDCPVEWMEQFREILDDYAHLFNADLFAQGFYHVAEQQTITNKGRGENNNNNSTMRIVGVAGLIPKGKPKKSKTWIVTAVSVHGDCRRCGLGERLLQAVFSDARELIGATRLELETLKEIMEPAWRLYEKMGFQRDGERVAFHANGSDRPRPMTVLQYSLDL